MDKILALYERMKDWSADDLLTFQLAMAVDTAVKEGDGDKFMPALKRVMKQAHLEDVLDYSTIKDFHHETYLGVAKKIMQQRRDEFRKIGLNFFQNTAYRVYQNILSTMSTRKYIKNLENSCR